MNISERLFNLRKNKNLSQEELANILGVSRQTISKWETGESTPDFDKIIPLCEFYGITSDELLSGKKDIVEAKKEEKNEHPIVSQVCGIIALVGVISYLIISFLTGAWHISWIIFIIMGLCCAIAKLIFSLKEENNNNKEGSDNNE